MAKFLDKKEQVYDLQITSYGRYLLSIGSFKPAHYAFFDDNIIYDSRYMGGSGPSTAGTDPALESQNNINKRIKQETPYLESLVTFRDVENYVASNSGETINFFDMTFTPTKMTPDADIFKFNSVIGDAYLDGETQAAPAWQVLMLQNNISSSVYRQGGPPVPTHMSGVVLHSPIPQINVKAIYKLRESDPQFNFNAANVRETINQSPAFQDKRVIQLVMEDPLIYFDELNTQILTENFEIEVFEVLSGTLGGVYSPIFERKYFQNIPTQVQNGFMMTATPEERENITLTTSSVEYYFDVLTDNSVNHTVACRGQEVFSKKSYYIDLDFDCTGDSGESVFYDIYGAAIKDEDLEICQT